MKKIGRRDTTLEQWLAGVEMKDWEFRRFRAGWQGAEISMAEPGDRRRWVGPSR